MISPGSIIGIVGGGQLGRMLAMAGAQLGYKCHIFDPHERPCAADVAAKFTRARFDDQAALEDVRRSRRCRHLRVRKSAGRAVARARRQIASWPQVAGDRAGPRRREGVHRIHRRPGRAVALGRKPGGCPPGGGRARDSGRAQDPALRVRRKRPGVDPFGRRDRIRLGSDRRRACGCRSRRRFRGRILGHRRALGGWPHDLLGQPGQRPSRRYPADVDGPFEPRGRRPGRGGAQSRGRRLPRRLATSESSPSSSSLRATARSSTRSRRASTTAATGPSRAPSLRSSSSTSAPSAVSRPARQRLPHRRCRWTI